MESENAVQIIGADYYLPDRKMTLNEMSRITGVSCEVISQKIGIEEKRVAAHDEQPSDLAIKAGRLALKGIDPSSIDMVIYCGATPVDYPFWVCAHKVQAELGLANAFVFDLNAICAGTVYALFIARSILLTDHTIDRILIVGGEKFSAICDATTYENLSALRYADGGGAMVVERGCKYNEVLGSHFISKGELHNYVKVPAGGTKTPSSSQTIAEKMHCIRCNDPEKLKKVFQETYVQTYCEIIEKSLAKSGLAQKKPDYLVLNQTDSRSTNRITSALGIPDDRMIFTRKTLGHMGIVDQIMIWKMLHEQNPLRNNDIVVLASSGIGFSWGAIAVKFHQNFLEG